MKTFSPSASDITRKWHLIDAKDQILGRLATQIASLLMGKHKTDFIRHMDIADHVVVINAKDIVVTGRKAQQKNYYRHSGYPGGFKVTKYSTMKETHSDQVITHAVSGMLPQNRLHDKILTHLHIFSGSEHDFSKQFKKPSQSLNDSMTQ
jgi:large subunit ribosomal protein L13